MGTLYALCYPGVPAGGFMVLFRQWLAGSIQKFTDK